MLETQGFYNVDGVNLEYRLLTPSPRTALTLVLLHEGLGCLAMWKDFPRRLGRATGCQILVYSRAGYGGSDLCPLPRQVSFMHDEGLNVLPKILDQAEIQQAVLLGHSDGASIALIGAGGRKDERICGLILMAPHVFVEELTLASIREAAIAYGKTDLRERLARYHGSNVDPAFLGWSQVWLDESFASWNIAAYLPEIKVPVLLIQGEDDNYGSIRQLEMIDEKLPQGAEVVTLAHCGHSPFRDRPAETLRLMSDFLQGISLSG